MDWHSGYNILNCAETERSMNQQNVVLQAILERRSIRAFSEKRIEEEDLEKILQAAIYAPSGMNRQTWQFTALVGNQKISELAKLVGQELKRESYDFYAPAVLVLTSNERDSVWGREDNACAMENMFLAAYSLGIGSVWINQLQGICDCPAIREFLREAGILDSHVVYGAAALGYPAESLTRPVEKQGVIRILCS